MDAFLMNKNVEILKLKIDEHFGTFNEIKDIYNLDYMPVGISTKDNIPSKVELYKWWAGRSIPASRDGIQEVLFRFDLTNPQELAMKALGLSLSDQYWVKPADSAVKWEDVNFFQNSFSKDVGDAFFKNKGLEKEDNYDLKSPDNTSDGWLKKKWIIRDTERYLLKAGSGVYEQEPFNEVISSKLLERMNTIPYVKYVLVEEEQRHCSACKNFITPDTEFVSAYAVYQVLPKKRDTSVYDHLVLCADYLQIPKVREFLDGMLAVDYVINNSDRHFGNFGFIRNVNSLKFEGPAPLFDNGTSLWCNSPRIAQADDECKPFKRSHTKQIHMVKNFDSINLSSLKGIEEEWNDLLKKSTRIDSTRRAELVQGLLSRVKRLNRIIQNEHSIGRNI